MPRPGRRPRRTRSRRSPVRSAAAGCSQRSLDTGTPQSVSIAVAGNAKTAAKTVTPRAFWRDQFHRHRAPAERDEEERATARGRDRKEEGEGKPTPIHGVGDEAFWS